MNVLAGPFKMRFLVNHYEAAAATEAAVFQHHSSSFFLIKLCKNKPIRMSTKG